MSQDTSFSTQKSFWKNLRTLALHAAVLYRSTGQRDARNLRCVQCRLSQHSRYPKPPEPVPADIASQSAHGGGAWALWVEPQLCGRGHVANLCHYVIMGTWLQGQWCTLGVAPFCSVSSWGKMLRGALWTLCSHHCPSLPVPSSALGEHSWCRCCPEAANQVERSQALAKQRGAALLAWAKRQGWVEPNAANHSRTQPCSVDSLGCGGVDSHCFLLSWAQRHGDPATETIHHHVYMQWSWRTKSRGAHLLCVKRLLVCMFLLLILLLLCISPSIVVCCQ